ncbi:MAG: sugar phosphate nucleotidyltransferase [Thermoanaerobaculia bacterium]
MVTPAMSVPASRFASSPVTRRAVVLAAGRGSRLRAGAGTAGPPLTDDQTRAASAGLKGLVPLAGRPLLDRALEALSASGVEEVCLVVGPATEAVRRRYAGATQLGVAVAFARQESPRGTADALLAAEAWAAEAPFLMVNSDNLYPPEGLRRLESVDGCGVLALDRDALLAGGETNVGPRRLAAFALIETDGGGMLRRIREKPGPDALATAARPVLLGVNAWRFTPAIFEACRAVEPSARGELELPAAVQRAVDELGERFAVVTSGGPFWDLTEVSDIPELERRWGAPR